jgi:hypothetical protein
MKVLALLTFENSIIIAYTLIGFISLVAYLPQIKALVKAKGASRDVSIQTWGIWTTDSMVSLLYAVFILKDAIASMIFCVDFFGALLILGLTARNRIRADGFNVRSMRIAKVALWSSKE